MSHVNRRTGKQGFTLIELLVVIAIIAILAAILFPVFARARANARRSACQSNLKQLGLSVHQYCQDYDGTYPMCWSGNFGNLTADGGGTGGAYSIVVALDPYTKNRQIWVCPERSSTAPTRPGDYGYNYSLLGADFGNPPPPGNLAQYAQVANEAALTSTATTIMMGDIMWGVVNNPGASWINWNNGGVNTTPELWYEWVSGRNINSYIMTIDFIPGTDVQVGGPARAWTMPGNFTNGNTLANRHFGNPNILYCDGHVKWRKVSEIYAHSCGDAASEFCNGK